MIDLLDVDSLGGFIDRNNHNLNRETLERDFEQDLRVRERLRPFVTSVDEQQRNNFNERPRTDGR